MKKLLVCILILSSGFLFSIDLETEKSKLEIDFMIVTGFSVYSETTFSWGTMFDLKKAEISFKGKKNDVSFIIEADFSELINAPAPVLSDILGDCYFQYRFFKELKIRVGNFKPPFSEEYFLGIDERPYPDHFFSVKNLGPGRSIGLMVHGKDILDLFGYKIGIFNSLPVGSMDYMNFQQALATAGKVYFSDNITEWFFLKFGYSAYLGSNDLFSHGLFADTRFNINKNHNIRLFCEYLEQKYYNYYWNYGLSAFLSYRYNTFETYICFELFDRNVSALNMEDFVKLSPGINFYTEKDHLRIGLEYGLGKNRFNNTFSHEISLYTVLEL